MIWSYALLFLTLALQKNRALELCVIFMFLVSLENVKKCARLPQRLKSTYFEKNSHSVSVGSFGAALFKFFSKNVDFSLRGKQCIVP